MIRPARSPSPIKDLEAHFLYLSSRKRNRLARYLADEPAADATAQNALTAPASSEERGTPEGTRARELGPRGIWKEAATGIGPLREDAQDLPAWPFVAAYSMYLLGGSWARRPDVFGIIMLVLMLASRSAFPARNDHAGYFPGVGVGVYVDVGSGGRVDGVHLPAPARSRASHCGLRVRNARKTLSVRVIVGTMWGFSCRPRLVASSRHGVADCGRSCYLVPRSPACQRFVKGSSREARRYPVEPVVVDSRDPRPSAVHLREYVRQHGARVIFRSRFCVRAVATLDISFHRCWRVRRSRRQQRSATA